MCCIFLHQTCAVQVSGGQLGTQVGPGTCALDGDELVCSEFEGSSKEAPRYFQGSSLEEPDFGRFVHHSMPSRAETFCLRLSVSKHVIAFTVNVSIMVATSIMSRDAKACRNIC